MSRLICLLRGHNWTPVREIGAVARPGGLLPSLDGFIAYKPHPDGEHRACVRCRRVVRS